MGRAVAAHQVCMTFHLRPGSEDEYDRRHRTVSADHEETIRAAGVTGSVVYRVGTLVIVLLDHPVDAGTALREINASASARRWGERFADLIATEPEQLKEVWRLT